MIALISINVCLDTHDKQQINKVSKENKMYEIFVWVQQGSIKSKKRNCQYDNEVFCFFFCQEPILNIGLLNSEIQIKYYTRIQANLMKSMI